MVTFRGVPEQVLDSDDSLYDLERMALRQYHPVHFEIVDNLLIVAFKEKLGRKQLDVCCLSLLIFFFFLNVCVVNLCWFTFLFVISVCVCVCVCWFVSQKW